MKTANNSRWALALAMAGILWGCSANSELSDGEANPLDPTAGVPLEITSTLETGMEETATRAVPPPVALDAGSIGIFLEGARYQMQENIEYRGVNGVWSASDPSKTLLLNAFDASVCAYYPYNVNKTDKTQIAMATQEYNETERFYYAPNRTVNGTTPGARTTQFAMRHAYARVRFHITRAKYPTTCVISAITFGNPHLPTTGTLNIGTGTCTITPGDFTFTTGLPKTLGENETYTRDLLVVPQADAMTESSTVTISVDKQAMTASIPTADLSKIEAGKQYEINIAIQGTGIVPTVTTTDWVASKVNNGNEFVPTPGPEPLPSAYRCVVSQITK